MTGFDTKWTKHPESTEEQNIVMHVDFRPDKLPKDKAEWYEWLSNYAKTTAKLIKKAGLPITSQLYNKKTEDFIFVKEV